MTRTIIPHDLTQDLRARKAARRIRWTVGFVTFVLFCVTMGVGIGAAVQRGDSVGVIALLVAMAVLGIRALLGTR